MSVALIVCCVALGLSFVVFSLALCSWLRQRVSQGERRAAQRTIDATRLQHPVEYTPNIEALVRGYGFVPGTVLRTSSDEAQEGNENNNEWLLVADFGDELVAMHDEACTMCLTEYKYGDAVLRSAQCNHVFHRHCVAEWLEKKKSECPSCQMQFGLGSSTEPSETANVDDEETESRISSGSEEAAVELPVQVKVDIEQPANGRNGQREYLRTLLDTTVIPAVMPRVQILSGRNGRSGPHCGLCCQSLARGEEVTVSQDFQCMHMFHVDCMLNYCCSRWDHPSGDGTSTPSLVVPCVCCSRPYVRVPFHDNNKV